MEGNWLQDYLEDAVRRHLCTQVGCTTCGSAEFRDGLYAGLRKQSGQSEQQVFNQELGIALLKALAQVSPAGDYGHRVDFENAVRFILYDLWRSHILRRTDRDVILSSSWAGEVLERMKAHYDSRLAAQQRHELLNDPIEAQKRREEKKRLKEEKHALRLAAKKERDRIWFEGL